MIHHITTPGYYRTFSKETPIKVDAIAFVEEQIIYLTRDLAKMGYYEWIAVIFKRRGAPAGLKPGLDPGVLHMVRRDLQLAVELAVELAPLQADRERP